MIVSVLYSVSACLKRVGPEVGVPPSRRNACAYDTLLDTANLMQPGTSTRVWKSNSCVSFLGALPDVYELKLRKASGRSPRNALTLFSALLQYEGPSRFSSTENIEHIKTPDCCVDSCKEFCKAYRSIGLSFQIQSCVRKLNIKTLVRITGVINYRYE